MGEAKERWKELCEKAVREQDQEKFLATIEELLEELEAKEAREAKEEKMDGLGQRMPGNVLPTH